MITSFQWINTGYTTGYEWLTKGSGGWKKLIFPAYAGLLKHDTLGYILFDTGYGDSFKSATKSFPYRLYRWVTPVFYDPANGIVSRLKKLGIAVDQIRYIFLSHLHADHIGSLKEFPDAQLICHEDCKNLLKKNDISLVQNGILPDLIPEDFLSRTHFLSKENAIADKYFGNSWTLFENDVKAVALPGHAVGQTGIQFNLEGKEIFLVADATWFTSVIETKKMPHKMVSLIEDDWVNYQKTVSKLHDYGMANPETIMIPSHCTEIKYPFTID